VLSNVALAVLFSGRLQYQLGWRAVNMGVLPLIAATVIAIAWLALVRRAAARSL
jgi:hypothetical protein